MSKHEDSFVSAIQSRTRDLCIGFLRGNPEITVRELQELCRGAFGQTLSTITLGELSADHVPGSPPKTTTSVPKGRKARGTAKAPPAKAARVKSAKLAKTSPDAAPAKAAKQATSAVDTRTPEGRKAFDEAVFSAIKDIGRPAAAGEILQRTGGTNLQLRTACNRLIEANRLSWSGKARGTRYFLP